ncbi:MAG: cobalamin biosynthesis protein CobQ [Oscillospiraceae bacterium]|nr:cobalamin biosynthesis protein CobQ [Oscillospiraceae bacterium]
MTEFKNIIIITGHYGSGKTNIAANLALKLAEQDSVSIVDLDIVNAYFRTADFQNPANAAGQVFSGKNIKIIASKYANSSLDVPALGFDIAGAVKSSGYTIIDVGGDDEGARALGRYRDFLLGQDYDMLYVVNKSRLHTQTPEEALELLRAIESVSGLKCTGIINNTHLCEETTPELIEASLPYAKEIAEKAGVPLLFSVGLDFPVRILVKKVWE